VFDGAKPVPARSAVTQTAEVAIPNTRKEGFVSKVNGHRYVLTVALPYTAAPAEGYGVLYVLDGYWYFASATELVRMVGNPSAVVVVGIGYPDDATYTRKVGVQRAPVPSYLATLPSSQISPYLERTYDLTLPATDEELAVQTLHGIVRTKSRNVGGLNDFLKIIETEVKPRVAALAAIDFTNQALFGHSLGGLAVLHALFIEPAAFRTFIISSPSIWWNNREVLADERQFAAAVHAGQAQPRVLVTVGSEESTSVIYPDSWGIDNAAVAAYLRKNRMVENAAELVTRLKALHGGPGYRVESCAIFENVNHAASPWSALSRGIPFAFPPLGG
jgi:predicted alpha/beta superfamily hydrolase